MAFRSTYAPVVLAFALSTGAAAVPGRNERIVSDPATGIALYGVDPVSYFTEGRAVPGRRDVEAEWGGAAWRFASEANRAAFLSTPETYAPRFGGYDPETVASGVAAAGHPLLFRIVGAKLYLFRTARSRASFRDFRRAEKAWPRVRAALAD